MNQTTSRFEAAGGKALLFLFLWLMVSIVLTMMVLFEQEYITMQEAIGATALMEFWTLLLLGPTGGLLVLFGVLLCFALYNRRSPE